MGQVPLEGGSGHIQDLSGLTTTQPLHPGQFKPRDDPLWSAEFPPLPLGSLEASLYALDHPAPFEFRNRTKNVELKTPGWCGGVDAFGQRDESDPDGLEII